MKLVSQTQSSVREKETQPKGEITEHWRKVDFSMRWSAFLLLVQSPDIATEGDTLHLFKHVSACVEERKRDTSCRLT